jgi:hypothetical protein
MHFLLPVRGSHRMGDDMIGVSRVYYSVARAGRGKGNATFLSRSPCRRGYHELAQLVE